MSKNVLCIVAAAVCVGCSGGGGGGGGDGGPSGPPPTATLSGIVREAGSQSAIAGATVKAGSATATTSANGHFTLTNVSVGSVSVTVDAAGFDRYTQSVTVQTGGTSHDISLNRKTIYATGEIVAYLPPGISTYRGVLFVLAGSTGDSRAFVRGEPVCWAPPPGIGAICPTDPDFRLRLLTLAERYGLALFGAQSPPVDGPEAYNAMLAALVSVAQESGRTELATAPLLLIGSSRGGCLAHGFTRVHPQRVIGFMSAKGNCHTGGPSPALSVPGYLFIGEEDPVSPGAIVSITQLFLENRSQGAVWALAIESGGGHEFPINNDLHFAWLDTVLAARLPASGVTLRPVTEASGWLANRSTMSVAGYACYTGDKLLASWLPSEQTARHWQSIVVGGGNGTVTPCNSP